MSTLNRDHIKVIEMVSDNDEKEDEGHKSALIVYQHNSNDDSGKNMSSLPPIHKLAEDSEITSD